MGGGRLLSRPGGLVPPLQPVALRNGRPRARQRGSPPRERRGPACAGPLERVTHRHHLFGCRDRWTAAGQLPAGYIIPLMSGMPPWPPSFSGGSATIASVVRMFLAIDAAFWSAERVTIAGSITPACTRSSIAPVCALR